MASSIIGALRAVLGLDTAQFESGADRAKASSGGLKQALLSTAAAVGGMVPLFSMATVAVSGFAIGMKLAVQASAYADDIAAQSYKLGVSAEYLQAFNFAAGESDVEISKAVDALSGLTAAVGALQTGVGDGKIRKAMEALGITQAQIDSFKSAQDALPVIADKIAALGTVTEQLQFAKKFGIEALLPMLKQGSAGIQGMMERARDLGLVLDEDVVTGLADMSRELEIAEARSAMAGNAIGSVLAPALVIVKERIAELLIEVSNLIEGFKEIENRSASALKHKRDQTYWKMSELLQGNGVDDPSKLNWFARAQYDRAKKGYDAALAELDRRQYSNPAAPTAASRASGVGGRGESNSPKSKAAKAAKDDLLAQARAHREAVEAQANEYARIFAKDVIDPSKLQDTIGNAVLEGAKSRLGDLQEEFSDTIYSATRNGLDALRSGGLEGFGQWFASLFTRALDDKIANGVSNLFSRGMKSSGGTGMWSSIKALAGFDTGGGFQVGGFGGTDSQIRALRLTPGEQVSVTRGNDLGGRLNQIFHVNAQGAVLAADLVSEMQRVGAVAAGVGGEVGSQAAQAQAAVASRYRIARS